MGGTSFTWPLSTAARCNLPTCFWRHSSHSPPALLVCCPQAHARCRTPPATDAKDGTTVWELIEDDCTLDAAALCSTDPPSTTSIPYAGGASAVPSGPADGS